MNTTQSVSIYLGIMFISLFFARASQRLSINQNDGSFHLHAIKTSAFVFSFFVPWLFVAFSKVGVDYKNYYNIIHGLNWDSFHLSHYNEAGMNLVFLCFRELFFGNIDVSIFAVKTITIVIVGISCYMLRENIKMEFSVAAYLGFFYLPSFYLISMCFAASIVYFAIAIYLSKNKVIVPALIIIVAAQMHNSCYLMLPVYFACVYLRKESSFSKTKKVFLAVGYIAAIALSSTIFNWATRFIASFHYNDYVSREASGTGLYFLLLYAPLAYIVYRMNGLNQNKNINNCLFVFALTSCLINILSYRFRVIERIELLLLPIYMFFIPYDLLHENVLFPKGKKTTTTVIGIIIIAYYIFRTYLVFQDRVTLASGLARYGMFNPFLQ